MDRISPTGKPEEYDAFLCYSRTADVALAIALRDALHAFARPWRRRRAVKVFRDDSSLGASPGLWPSIARKLDDSRYLVLLASAEAARSPWVERELRYWCEHKDPDRILLVLTDPAPDRGHPPDIAWDDRRNDFDWSVTTVVPRCLSAVFAAEPRWVRLARTVQPLSLRDPVFTSSVADVAAPLRGVSKDELIGEDLPSSPGSRSARHKRHSGPRPYGRWSCRPTPSGSANHACPLG